MDERGGNITIIEPESRFKKVDKSLIENPNIDCLTLGVYTKIVVLGKRWQLNVKGLSKFLGVSNEKIRKSLTILENEGYLLRTPARNSKGQMAGWDYTIFPTPINENERSQVGSQGTKSIKTRNTENRCTEIPSSETRGDINNRLNESKDLTKSKNLNNNNYSEDDFDDLEEDDDCLPFGYTEEEKAQRRANRIKERELEKQLQNPIYEGLNLNTAMLEVINEWKAYKKERRQTYTPKGEIMFIKKLLEYSKGCVSVARQIVENSMANNYAGIYEPKQTTTTNRTGVMLNVNDRWK